MFLKLEAQPPRFFPAGSPHRSRFWPHQPWTSGSWESSSSPDLLFRRTVRKVDGSDDLTSLQWDRTIMRWHGTYCRRVKTRCCCLSKCKAVAAGSARARMSVPATRRALFRQLAAYRSITCACESCLPQEALQMRHSKNTLLDEDRWQQFLQSLTDFRIGGCMQWRRGAPIFR